MASEVVVASEVLSLVVVLLVHPPVWGHAGLRGDVVGQLAARALAQALHELVIHRELRAGLIQYIALALQQLVDVAPQDRVQCVQRVGRPGIHGQRVRPPFIVAIAARGELVDGRMVDFDAAARRQQQGKRQDGSETHTAP